MPRFLILVRHSQSQPDDQRPAREWPLSETGRARCVELAHQLRAYDPAVFVSSTEPKAIETAQITAALLSKSHYSAEGLHEHERPQAAWLGQAAFEETIARFFALPDQLVFGAETADQAYLRFSQAVHDTLTRYSGTVALVTHGTVLTLFAARAAGIAPFPFWKTLQMPSFVVLSIPDFQLIETIHPA